MTIFHFKHGYLNWRSIPCRRKMIVVFHHFFNKFFWIWLFWFSFGLNRIFQVHDMTINFSFFLFSSFVLMIRLLRATTHAIDDLSDWSTTPHVRIILKRVVFWFKGCSRHFCPKKGYGSKVFHLCQQGKGLWFEGFSRNGQFLINVPQGINQGDFKVSRFWGFYFWSLKGFGRLEVIASLNAYQITKYQNPTKTYHFFLPDFRKIREKEFLNQEFYGKLPEQAWSKGSSNFSKIVPFGAPRSHIQMVSKWRMSVYRDGFITNSNHQFFQDPKSNIWTTFSFFCSDFMIMKFIPF